ncbi:hypothetical protein [Prauserella cavernicola]|uniref:Uncharacterized protein n=1 Tax=Prauserella cavernicola TaxID=2800127 RepID=A0A934QR85_9PSEU|nr:hypothetical protein [Prauserella cavernicola]MBK1785105.1 hypothetical protein [Prauserella cavernicola]
MAYAQVIAAPAAAELADVPIVYRCPQRVPDGHYYREISPGVWETSLRAEFSHSVRVEDTSRAQIEARGHILVPLHGGETR